MIFTGILYWMYNLIAYNNLHRSGLNIKLLEPLAQGASRFEKLLAPQKSTGPHFFQTT